ncbi:putative RNA binding protein YcfA (HicA-like mRNA interferase family) [Mycobacterium frederiksbergense]|uniref:RNA binding protein YcfA (HicA-like mRNA interferase family) n=1 Tax=Mycolicibacterium frederiksbergense TaxID=117567 RepID=A0ABT6KXN5_9MYCO|nr:PASTA domain-containing protein [Mycolicibacterium frederiksbergense]MDH6195472.1 putative RNA binding protein YcfA (HicA-like mRNA interferase family) [Mycolicibacterium frederiksbergense]
MIVRDAKVLKARIAVAAHVGLVMFAMTSCAAEEASSDEIVLPNLVGLYWKDAFKQLQTAGWTGVIDKGPYLEVEPKDRGRIIVQHPGGASG